ncbi:MAG: hypothetical protein NC548_33595 [Lachnospiraceae bacterium]|nr:hypothetical protein [Lachnospiraceae bacterium]
MISGELYTKLQKQARIANAKLQRLEGHFGTRESWAGATLISKLKTKKVQGLTEKGFVKFSKYLEEEQAEAILKAVEKFNEAETSTVAGVNKAIQTIKDRTAELYDISPQEADIIYDFMHSPEYTGYEMDLIASRTWVFVAIKSAKRGYDEDEFALLLKVYINDEAAKDVTLQKNLKNIYNKYFKDNFK